MEIQHAFCSYMNDVSLLDPIWRKRLLLLSTSASFKGLFSTAHLTNSIISGDIMHYLVIPFKTPIYVRVHHLITFCNIQSFMRLLTHHSGNSTVLLTVSRYGAVKTFHWFFSKWTFTVILDCAKLKGAFQKAMLRLKLAR